jgi:hypothetical protein
MERTWEVAIVERLLLSRSKEFKNVHRVVEVECRGHGAVIAECMTHLPFGKGRPVTVSNKPMEHSPAGCEILSSQRCLGTFGGEGILLLKGWILGKGKP